MTRHGLRLIRRRILPIHLRLNEKVKDLKARLAELAAEKKDIEARRERLELPAIDKEMLASLLDNFEKVMIEGVGSKYCAEPQLSSALQFANVADCRRSAD